MKPVCYIVGACDAGKLSFADSSAAFVIAADGGLSALEAQGVAPDLIVGDFDSLGRIPRGDHVLRYPPEKDDTDTMLAVKLGLERGFREFVLYGCTGGRPDHMYANLQTLRYLAGKGGRGYLVGDGWVSCVICGGALSFPAGMDGTVSVFCPDGVAEGVTLRGLKYSLEDASLQSDFPLGVSNQFTGEEADVLVSSGSLLVMWEESAEHLMQRLR